jgi:mannose-6-phosphate isomerase class I
LAVPLEPKLAYKRSYFIDWVVLNQHKASILNQIDVLVDTQRPDEPSFIGGMNLRESLERMSHSSIRVRPWFEPGVWGGQRIKSLVPELPQDASNYAWSFELITPENGLVFESDGIRLEVTFDTLMFQAHKAILGEAAARFGFEFPIRFDWLDTIKGGNLSVQCHPRPGYILQHFSENFTQDETYYILEAEPKATVYLGFQEGINPDAFRNQLEQSAVSNARVEIEEFVQKHPAQKHDLFLIPNGTIHCSGTGSLVLEISATPYIFTFKMYDWLRLDLDGQPRPLNIERAFENLHFEYQGEYVTKALIAKPEMLEQGADWRIVHLATHVEHFYDVHRLEFKDSIEIQTNGQCHVLALVEGSSVMVETVNGQRQRYHYAETFIVPAAAVSYRLINEGKTEIKVVKAFVKSES